MADVKTMTVDGNEAAAYSAYRLNDVYAIYPITPSSPLGEFSDEWAAKKIRNIWGEIPDVAEMQSEAGAAGAVHGSLQAGALTSTFTASQGLLLMIPNMYKIAGELLPTCFHVTARTLATHALSIFGDHSDVMACRQTGFAMLSSNNVQEAHDLACIGSAATLKSRVPFMHFFDGFRTSHEVQKITSLSEDDLRSMIDEEAVKAFRERALTPDRPQIRGTAQNPDTFFQAREACNQFYDACPAIVQEVMDQFAERVGRRYNLFDYVGHPDAERVIMAMGSGCEAIHETVDYLVEQGEKVGLVKVRLYRPFCIEAFVKSLPVSTKTIAVLDRTKEPGAVGEPMYLDVVTALDQAKRQGLLKFAADPVVVGGRYGLSSKEFTPAMVKAVYDNLAAAEPANGFTVGINDDVTRLSLDFDPEFIVPKKGVTQAVFFGLGADGTVGANKNSIKIIGDATDMYAQGYFVYDSKKSGGRTVSHLRFGPDPIRSTYLIDEADFVACHLFGFLEKTDVLKYAKKGATFLLNSPYPADEVWEHFSRPVQEAIIKKGLKVHVIDGLKVASDAGMGTRINTVMQTCFFYLAQVLPADEAIELIKKAIVKTYGKKGDHIVKMNMDAVDSAIDNLHPVSIPDAVSSDKEMPPVVSDIAPDFVKRVTAMMMSDQGDLLPVSAFPVDGTYDTATTQWEKRGIAPTIPIWEAELCIQCNKCAFVCPHAAIRPQVYEESELSSAPAAFRSIDYKAKDFKGMKFTIQVAPEDCTGCGLCVQVCPAKDKAEPKRKAINMANMLDHVEAERANYEFFLNLPNLDRTKIEQVNVKGSQLYRPLFEYSGACTGCGETPYVKLLSQLFGDRLLIGNATGCSSIYGGNLPTTPYCVDRNGRGPAWSNSLFEDNAEYGFGHRLAVDALANKAGALLNRLNGAVPQQLKDDLLNAEQITEADFAAQRGRVEELRGLLANVDSPDAKTLSELADYLVRKSIWMLGGDGWAYDIGYGGLDHVIASNRNVNILVMDTEVYSNTGGQASKATPIGAAAKFAAAGKEIGKKDLGLMAMSYGHVYVASVAFGKSDAQTVKAFLEAESYPGPSIIIAYSHCIAHGYNLLYGLDQQKRAVESGIWPLYRYDPRLAEQGKPPLQLESGPIKCSVSDYMNNEARFRMVEKIDPNRFKRLAAAATRNTAERIAVYKHMAEMQVRGNGAEGGNGEG